MCACNSGFTYNGVDCNNACGVGSQQIMVNGVCYSVVGHAGTCQVTEQCNYGFGQCISGVCGCAPGYTYSGTFCTNGIATTVTPNTNCASTQISINNACYNTAQLGQPCAFSAQCIGTPNLVCSNGICSVSCQSNQILITNVCYNLVNPGQTCSFSQQCLGGTTCINNVCGTVTITTVAACSNGQVQFNGRCSSSIGNGCIDYPCISDRCSGVFPACRYVQPQNSYFCCQTLAATSPGPVVATTQMPAANMPTCR
uniref:EB domain-containing protein n=1 Tax=Plectus sambesii TaxID=2011161 RepID=A0A914V5U8_9BILA